MLFISNVQKVHTTSAIINLFATGNNFSVITAKGYLSTMRADLRQAKIDRRRAAL